MKFSEKIIQARKAKALTQEDLAEAVGVSRQAVSKWETEEAKPDLDKLVAICNVLDLSMDYLCLDRQSVTVEDPQPTPVKNRGKRNLIIGLCIGVAAAIIVGLLAIGLLGGFGSGSAAQSGDGASNYADLLDKVQVADAKCETVVGSGRRTLHVSFVPSVQIPGMKVQIAVRDNKIGSTYYKDATKSGTGYVIEYPRPDYGFDYDFIAVCTIGDITVQFPLVNVESSDGTGYHWDYLWKE